MSVINPEKISNILRECSDLYVLPRYQKLRDDEVSSKTNPHDLVTAADREVEDHLARVLPDILPGSRVLGEEGVSEGTVSLDMLNETDAPLWIVDPVDGTFNFVHGRREFGVMLALIIDGVTQFGWIYDVLGDAMSSAERGSGAYCDAVRLSVAPKCSEVGAMHGHINPKYFSAEVRGHIQAQRQNFASCHSIGSAAHEYLRIARGEAQFAVYSNLKPWDHIPGALIVREAGGVVSKWCGETYMPHEYDTGVIAAASDDDWCFVKDVFLSDM